MLGGFSHFRMHIMQGQLLEKLMAFSGSQLADGWGAANTYTCAGIGAQVMGPLHWHGNSNLTHTPEVVYLFLRYAKLLFLVFLTTPLV